MCGLKGQWGQNDQVEASRVAAGPTVGTAGDLQVHHPLPHWCRLRCPRTPPTWTAGHHSSPTSQTCSTNNPEQSARPTPRLPCAHGQQATPMQPFPPFTLHRSHRILYNAHPFAPCPLSPVPCEHPISFPSPTTVQTGRTRHCPGTPCAMTRPTHRDPWTLLRARGLPYDQLPHWGVAGAGAAPRHPCPRRARPRPPQTGCRQHGRRPSGPPHPHCAPRAHHRGRCPRPSGRRGQRRRSRRLQAVAHGRR
jgi:hypothetical protein